MVSVKVCLSYMLATFALGWMFGMLVGYGAWLDEKEKADPQTGKVEFVWRERE